MPLGTFRPGVHTATYNGTSLGLTTGDGFRLRWRKRGIPINNTGAYGDCLIEGIYRGVGGVQLVTTLKEINAYVQNAIWPWGAGAPPAFDGTIGEIGELYSSFAKPLVITAAAGSPALANAPAGGSGIFTASLALLADDNDEEFLFGPVETDVPVVFDLLVYDDAGTKRFFKWT